MKSRAIRLLPATLVAVMATPMVLSASVIFEPGASEVLIAPDACDVVNVAAEEATNFLSQALGAPVPIVTAPTPGRAALVLGANRWADAAGVTTNGLPRDGFRIRTAAGRVHVVGIDDHAAKAHRALRSGGVWVQNFEHATAFGTYDFLERFVGVRFYFPGELGTVVPRRSRIEVPDTDLADAPVHTVRRYSIYDHGLWFEGPKPDELRHPAKTRNWWRLRMETQYTPCCHGQNKFNYIDRFATSHPEYFALLPDGRRHNSYKITYPGHPGQICHSSKIWDEIYADAKSYLLGEAASVRGVAVYPQHRLSAKRSGWGSNCQRGRFVDVMPQDGMIKCSCPACTAAYAANPDKVSWASELIWRNVARLANRLIDEGIDGYVCNMAYSKYRHVPSVDIPTNVLVMVAERGPWTEADPTERRREDAEVKAWTEKLGGRKVWLWNYANKAYGGGLDGIPEVTPKAIVRYYAGLTPYIFGAFMESETDWSIFGYLNYYVFARVMWNPSVDVEALLDEHHRLMFGAAAPQMKELYETLERIWIERVAGKTLDTPLGPQSIRPSEYDLFMRIYTPAVIDRLEGLVDAGERLVPNGSIEWRRLEFVRRNIIGPLVARARAYVAQTDVARGLARDRASTALNLIRNGDFSAPRKGRTLGAWFAKADEADLDDAVFVTPPHSLRIRVSGGKATVASQYFRDATLKNMTMKKGQRYRLSYFIRLEGVTGPGPGAGAGVTIWDNKNNWFPSGAPFRGTQDWTYQVHEFTSDAQTGERQMPYIYLRATGTSGAVWFDDVRLEEVPDGPAAVSSARR